jgi:hypothetical protein
VLWRLDVVALGGEDGAEVWPVRVVGEPKGIRIGVGGGGERVAVGDGGPSRRQFPGALRRGGRGGGVLEVVCGVRGGLRGAVCASGVSDGRRGRWWRGGDGRAAGDRWRPEGSIAVSGDVRRLWRDQACELADALRLVGERLDACARQRYGSATGAAVVAWVAEG